MSYEIELELEMLAFMKGLPATAPVKLDYMEDVSRVSLFVSSSYEYTEFLNEID
jgi:hypothetical protein